MKCQIDDKLRFLQEQLVGMGNRVEKALGDTLYAFREKDLELALRIDGDDSLVDQMRTLVESDAVRVLISEAPYGTSMRTVIASMKIVTSLERMGDIAAKLSPLSKYDSPLDVSTLISSMAEEDLIMLRGCLEVLGRFDAVLAREIAKLDDNVDELCVKADNLICSMEPKDKKEREVLYRDIAVVKQLERFGDHATTICAWVVYLVEGEKPNLNQ